MRSSPQTISILQAIFVTVLWASSWVLIKLGLRASLPALTFAGLRYVLAFFSLMPLVLLNSQHRTAIKSFRRDDWGKLALLGIVFYTLTQGSQFLSLADLPAAMVSLMLNITPLVAGLIGIIFLREYPSFTQWFGITLTLIGVAFYFLPIDVDRLHIIGLIVAFGGVLTNAGSALLGRQVNHLSAISPLIITFISMGICSVLLLVIGVATQGFGKLDLESWLLIGWQSSILPLLSPYGITHCGHSLLLNRASSIA